MNRKTPASKLIASAVAPAIALLIVATFAGYAIIGQNGLLALPHYREAISARQVELAALAAEKARLLNHKRLLQAGDPDLPDEMTRGATGMIGEDEYIIVPGR